DPYDRSATARVLRHAGYEVTLVEDGPSALALTALVPPDLVLLDFSMVGMNGLEVAHRMRGQRAMRGVPILMLTGSALEPDVGEGFLADVDDYMLKPIHNRILEARVASALRASEYARRAAEARDIARERDALAAE